MTIAGQGGERVNTPTNITLGRTKSDLILIDTGSGPHFMPTAGKLLENMEAPGIDRSFGFVERSGRGYRFTPAT